MPNRLPYHQRRLLAKGLATNNVEQVEESVVEESVVEESVAEFDTEEE